MKRGILNQGALVLAAALAGGGVAVAVNSTKPESRTIVRTVEQAAQNATQPAPAGLTVGQIYQRSQGGVVVVTATSVTQQANPFDPFGAPQQQESQALGSGFVIDHQGHILTNAHVVLGASKVQVGFSNNKTYPAQVVGLDKSTDVAVLKVDVPAEARSPLALGTSRNVHVGDPVVAIGNPLGEERTVTSGIVSAVARQIDSLTQGIKIYGAIQTDAAINHGNSGGPLLDAGGRVIGITSQILSENNGNVGIGFAIPIDTVKEVAGQIIKNGKAQHTYLGIEGTDLTQQVASALNFGAGRGVLVERVVPDSPAAKAGLRGGTTDATIAGQTVTLGGDAIVGIDGKPITSFADLAETIALHNPGDTITLQVVRHGQTIRLPVTLAAH
jgi:S1-C subfamily serine protease